MSSSSDFPSWLFKQPCRFLRGVEESENLVGFNLPEVAFAGRSNVGKSSLINALTGRKTLARASNTPGRTQQLNFFSLGDHLVFVDMPGYGYAKASQKRISAWQNLMFYYLYERQELRRVYILVDSRHGLKENDKEFLTMLDKVAVPYQIVLTKADKISQQESGEVLERTKGNLTRNPAASQTVLLTSAGTGLGIKGLRESICEFVFFNTS